MHDRYNQGYGVLAVFTQQASYHNGTTISRQIKPG
jgi:hypothetical protein